MANDLSTKWVSVTQQGDATQEIVIPLKSSYCIHIVLAKNQDHLDEETIYVTYFGADITDRLLDMSRVADECIATTGENLVKLIGLVQRRFA